MCVCVCVCVCVVCVVAYRTYVLLEAALEVDVFEILGRDQFELLVRILRGLVLTLVHSVLQHTGRQYRSGPNTGALRPATHRKTIQVWS